MLGNNIKMPMRCTEFRKWQRFEGFMRQIQDPDCIGLDATFNYDRMTNSLFVSLINPKSSEDDEEIIIVKVDLPSSLRGSPTQVQFLKPLTQNPHVNSRGIVNHDSLNNIWSRECRGYWVKTLVAALRAVLSASNSETRPKRKRKVNQFIE